MTGLADTHTGGGHAALATGWPITGPARPDARLRPIRAKVESGERLTLEDGDLLYTTPDIWTVCELADGVRRRLNGDVGYYNINRHLNYSNVCALSCKFCEFYRKEGEAGSYTRDMQYVKDEVRRAVQAGATEIHSVGGLNPYLPWDYYPELVRTIRETARELGSDLHVKAFTAVEVVHLAKIAKVYKQADRVAGIRWVLEKLKEAGLGSLPGGGAEVFDDRVHDEAYKGKIRSDVWLDVHKTAHELGLNTTATILYGHIEERRERLVHMDMLRQAQDVALARMGLEGATERRSDEATKGGDGLGAEATERRSDKATEGGDGIRAEASLSSPTSSLRRSVALSLPPRGSFQTIIPLPFFPDGSDLEHLPGPSGLENLRTLAISRLMLDNFPHVKAFWIMQTLPMAQLMLQNGADDIDGTVVWYDITKLPGDGGGGGGGGEVGVATHQEVSAWTLRKAILDAGLVPVERDTLYRRVTREGNRWWAEG